MLLRWTDGQSEMTFCEKYFRSRLHVCETQFAAHSTRHNNFFLRNRLLNKFFPEEGLLKLIFSWRRASKLFFSISSGSTPRLLMVVPLDVVLTHTSIFFDFREARFLTCKTESNKFLSEHSSDIFSLNT